MIGINPVFKKEVKQNYRMIKTPVMFFLYNGVLVTLALFTLYMVLYASGSQGGDINYSEILRLYVVVAGVEFTLFLLLIPANTSGSISSERERKTMDILLSTQILPHKIILGKLAASISSMLLLGISSLPVLSIVFIVGGISFTDIIRYFVLLFNTAIFLGSISIFFSVRCKKTSSAAVLSFLTLLVVCFGSICIIFSTNLYHGENILQNIQTIRSAYSQVTSHDVGNLVLILLLNPVMTFLNLMMEQAGIGMSVEQVWYSSGKVYHYIVSHWFSLSCLLQFALSCILLTGAVRGLHPKKTKRKKK